MVWHVNNASKAQNRCQPGWKHSMYRSLNKRTPLWLKIYPGKLLQPMIQHPTRFMHYCNVLLVAYPTGDDGPISRGTTATWNRSTRETHAQRRRPSLWLKPVHENDFLVVVVGGALAHWIGAKMFMNEVLHVIECSADFSRQLPPHQPQSLWSRIRGISFLHQLFAAGKVGKGYDAWPRNIIPWLSVVHLQHALLCQNAYFPYQQL